MCEPCAGAFMKVKGNYKVVHPLETDRMSVSGLQAVDHPHGTTWAGRGTLSPTRPTGFLCPGGSSKEIKGLVNRGPPAVGTQH